MGAYAVGLALAVWLCCCRPPLPEASGRRKVGEKSYLAVPKEDSIDEEGNGRGHEVSPEPGYGTVSSADDGAAASPEIHQPSTPPEFPI